MKVLADIKIHLNNKEIITIGDFKTDKSSLECLEEQLKDNEINCIGFNLKEDMKVYFYKSQITYVEVYIKEEL